MLLDVVEQRLGAGRRAARRRDPRRSRWVSRVYGLVWRVVLVGRVCSPHAAGRCGAAAAGLGDALQEGGTQEDRGGLVGFMVWFGVWFW
jgi:anti-sigma factor RsiW